MTFTLTTIMIVVLGHWFADFVMQTDEQAKGKSISNYWLRSHVLGYTFWGLVPISLLLIDPLKGIVWVVINSGLHFVTDYFTSRLNTKLWNAGRTHDFFVSVGFDQVIHYACLFGTLYLLA